MKTTLQFTIAFVFLVSIFLNIQLYRGYMKLEERINQNITFIWNDDEESIPPPDSLITLEDIEGDTIYIGPYNKLAKSN